MPEIKPVALPQSPDRYSGDTLMSLLARRPNLQAMRWYVQASLDQVDSARALFYPSFDIKAFSVWTPSTGYLIQNQSPVQLLHPGLKLPLFDGGRLNAISKALAPPAT